MQRNQGPYPSSPNVLAGCCQLFCSPRQPVSWAAFFWSPKVRARSAIQHFAAGAVLAAVASNVIPEVERIGTVTGVLSGLVAGGLVMIGLKWLVVNFERRGRSKSTRCEFLIERRFSSYSGDRVGIRCGGTNLSHRRGVAG